MMTSFTRIVVVLSLLRTGLGTTAAPPNAVIVSLALFLTAGTDRQLMHLHGSEVHHSRRDHHRN
jgi:flagellar biosynthesis protein FliP